MNLNALENTLLKETMTFYAHGK